LKGFVRAGRELVGLIAVFNERDKVWEGWTGYRTFGYPRIFMSPSGRLPPIRTAASLRDLSMHDFHVAE